LVTKPPAGWWVPCGRLFTGRRRIIMSISKIALCIGTLCLVIVYYAEKRSIDSLIEDLKSGYND
jgi:hypothetical protein